MWSVLESQSVCGTEAAFGMGFKVLKCGDASLDEQVVCMGQDFVRKQTSLSREVMGEKLADVALSRGELSLSSGGALRLGISESLLSSKKTDVWAVGISILQMGST